MKFSKTFCKPSSVVSVVPAGLPVKLRYNQNGFLQEFSIGFDLSLDHNYSDPDAGQFNHAELFNRIKQFVPTMINLTGGTTWVYGVFYSDKIPCDEGILPQALYQSYIKDIISGGKYEFYAGYMKSLAANFNSPLAIRNFLSMAKFDLIPQIIVPITMSDETLQMLMNPSSYPFKYSFIAGFFIFEDTHCRYAASNLIQINVTNDPEPFVDSDGYLKGEIKTQSGRTYKFNYSAIVRHNVSKGCTLLVEREPEGSALTILSTRLSDSAELITANKPKEVKCPVCKKVYFVGYDDSPVHCDDPHCLSHLYENAVKFLKTFDLPTLSHNSYSALVDSRKIICIPDLLDIPPCSEEPIHTTLSKVLRAIVPVEVVSNFDLFERFVNKCNNSIDTFKYYLENPNRIPTDFDITDVMMQRFIQWLNDPYNLSDIISILSKVQICEKEKKFEGEPIFRGTRIAITGKFRHGDYSEIESILKSYSAEVVPSIELGQDLPNMVVVGSTMEGISGQMIQKARIHNIPVYYEDDFFVRYEIDQDLSANLL